MLSAPVVAGGGGPCTASRTRYRAVMSGWDDAEVERAPICPYCGVTALPRDPSNVIDTVFICENPDCAPTMTG